MNAEETAFVTYRRREGRYKEDLEFEVIKLEDTYSYINPIGICYDRGKGIGKDEYIMAYQSLVNTLNDLVKGQKEVLHSIKMLVLKSKHGQNSLHISTRDRGSTSSSRKHAYTHMKNTPHIYNKPSKPTMSHFLENSVAGLVMPVELGEPFGAYQQEYMHLVDDFHSAMPFSNFYTLKRKN